MRKFWFLIIALLLLVPISASCSNSVQTAAPQQIAPPSATNVTTPATTAAVQVANLKLSLLSNTNDPNDTTGSEIAWLADRISTTTNGKVKILLFPSEALFKNAENLGAVISGGADVAVVGSQVFSAYDPAWAVIEGSLILENVDHAIALFNTDVGKELMSNLEKNQGVKIWTQWCLRDPGALFNNKRPITKLEDFKGLKIRVPESKGIIASVNLLGANAISISMGEVPGAIQQGMIDGVVTMYQTAVLSFRIQDTCKYAFDEAITGGCGPWWYVLQNGKSWSKLTPDCQQGIQTAVKDLWAAKDLNKLAQNDLDKYKNQFKSSTGTVTTKLSAEEMARWRALLKPNWESTANSSGDLGKRILSKIEELRPQYAGK